MTSWSGDSIILDSVSSLILWFICFRTLQLRNEIKFGPYSIQGSATKLIKFASIQASFTTIDLIFTFVNLSSSSCQERPLPDSQMTYCVTLDLIKLTLYQCWVWFAVYFNWKMISGSERKESLDTSISFSATSHRSTALFLSKQ